jgi:hypothetical protein
MTDVRGAALLVIRVWCDEASDQPFRGEIRIADDVASGFRSTQTFVQPDALLGAARDFVENVVCPPVAVTAGSHLGHD